MLYLIRHAHAVPGEQDPIRPLSLQGINECTALVRFFEANGQLPLLQLWHSPLVRSRDTADRLAFGLKLDGARVEIPGITPDDEPEGMLERINALPERANIGLVGHEPHLARLATLLIRGRPKPVFCDFKKAAVMALRRTDSLHKRTELPRWELIWFVTPSLLTTPQS